MLKDFYSIFVRLCLGVVLLGAGVMVCGEGYGQVTIAIQDFESSPATPTYGFSGGGTFSTGSGSFPNDPKYVSGSRGREVSKGDITLEFDDINTSLYSDVELSFRLASFSGTSGNGADAADFVLVSISNDGGTTWSKELKITGSNSNNAYWSFVTGTGVASTAYDGNNTAVSFSPSNSGSATTDTYSFIKLSDLPLVDHLKVRIQLLNNNEDEYWVIDDVRLEGTLAVTTTSIDFSSATYTQTEDGTSIDLCVDITNEDAVATTADIVLIGSAPELSYTSGISFPSNSSTSQCATIYITDNATCDGNRDYTFKLQNVSGGNAAAVGSVDETVLTVTDDDQTSGTIAFQGFEGSGWSYTPSPAPYNADGGNDVWDIVSNLASISPSLGSNFWGMTDLDNPNGGGPFEHVLEFSSQNINSYSDVVLSFEYYTDNFNGSDKLNYQVSYNGNPYNSEITLNGNTDSWKVITISVPNGTSSVKLKLKAIQDGPQYAGWDNIKLTGTGCNTCEEPTAQSTFYTTSPTFPDETSASYNLTLTGNGQNRLIVLREGSAVTTDPVDGTSYPANAAFGFPGTDIGSNEYVVYNGPNNSALITNLIPGTEYYAKLFEYNCLPGSEDYLTSGTPDTDVFITPPENPATFIEGCTGSTSMDLSWTPPANGSYDGYMLVVRQGGVPTAVTSLDPGTSGQNTDYNLAQGYGTASKVLYIGNDLSKTITNLSANTDYTFMLLAYAIGTYGWIYSSGTTTSQNIHLLDVTNLSTTPHANTIEFSWNLDLSCVDEIIIAASDVGGVTSVPTVTTGYNVVSNSFTDPSNPTLSPGGEKVVFSSNSANVTTVTGLTTDQEYCFKVFVRKGNVWSEGVDICETPRSITVLEPGDISIVAINTKTGIGDAGSDEVCFLSYKSITAGTSIDLTDNGYERNYMGQWGDSEGVIRITRKMGAPTIPAGKVICVQGKGYQASKFSILTCGEEDEDWTLTSLNGNNAFDLNKEDQVWIMQNGSWIQNSGDYNDEYTGNVLYGWTATGWKSSAGYNDTKGSTLYPNSFCLSTDLESIGAHNDKVRYTGPMTGQNRIEWIEAFNDFNNWTGYETNDEYFSASPDYSGTCVQITIDPVIAYAGHWTGKKDNDWFNCKNWDNLRLPDETVGAVIKNVTNDPIINGPGAACYDLIIETGGKLELNDPTSELNIFGNLSLVGNLTNTDGTIVIAGDQDQNITDENPAISTIDFENLTINKTGGNLTTEENISITGEAVFTKGLLIPAVGVTMIFKTNATASGASNASFVDGKVVKEGISEEFIFPIGDTSGNTIAWYQPARIFGYSGSTTIEAEYFAEANPNAGAYYDGDSNSPNDNQEISNCDYWVINKNSGVNPKIGLKYTNTDPEYCNQVGNPSVVRISRWNSFTWDEISSAPNAPNEEIRTDQPITVGTGSAYGQMTLSGPGSNDLNVLPIFLLSFTAEAKEKQVLTSWVTSSEKNNDFFTVERSADAQVFKSIGDVNGAGTSRERQEYSFSDDAPLSGISYYRLRQTDFDGTSTLSEVRSVEFYSSGTFSLDMAYRSDDELSLAFTSVAPYLSMEIFDVFGQRVYGGLVENYGGRATVMPHLSRGVYVVRLTQGNISDSRKFFW